MYHKKITNTLSVLLVRAQKEIPEYGDNSTITEMFANKDSHYYCGDIYMVIGNLDSNINLDGKKHYFKLIVKTPSGLSDCSCILATGNKAELLDYLACEAFIIKLEEQIIEMANELRQDKFQ